MATWTTAAAVKARITLALVDIGATLDSSWDPEIAEDLEKAEQAMLTILVGEREYVLADIALANWPAGIGYEQDIAAFFFFVTWYAGHAREQVPWDVLKHLDRRDELREAMLVDASGDLLEPNPSAPAEVSGGALEDGAFIPTALNDEDEYTEG